MAGIREWYSYELLLGAALVELELLEDVEEEEDLASEEVDALLLESPLVFAGVLSDFVDEEVLLSAFSAPFL